MTGSLSSLPNYVPDAFRLVPGTPFTPENVVFGHFTFLPWARTGIAAAVQAPAAGIRAGVTVTVPVEGGAAPVPVSQELLIRGPGDVLAISGSQVIRRYPQSGAMHAEDTFLAHIEFDRPDFPWIFTPAAPSDGGSRLTPWIALVVLRAARAELKPSSAGLPARVRTTKSELQPLDDSWAWAHVQLVGPPDPPSSIADRLTPQYGDVNLSRLLCPRRLQPDQDYLACVVPAYDAGVKIGLADTSSPPTLDPAWGRQPDGSDADDEIVLPVYTSWTFSTAADGDFRSLAELLVPVPAPWHVGRRILDTARPGGDLTPLDPGEPGRLQTIFAPLVSPQEPSLTSTDPAEQAAAAAEAAAWAPERTEKLRGLLNTPDVLAKTPPDVLAKNPPPRSPGDLPLIGPEIYARYQAAATRIDTSRDGDWFGQLNLRPRDRVIAGLGARVVERDQEALMQSAWAQVGRIDEVNSQLRPAQLARFMMQSLHSRTFAALGYGPLLQASRTVHGRILASDGAAPRTVLDELAASALAETATSGAFRRITRPRGPLARYADVAALGLVAHDGVPRDYQRPYADLDGVAGVSEAAARVIDPAVVGAVLGLGAIDADAAASALVDQGTRLAQTPAVADLLTPEAVAGAAPALPGRLSDLSAAAVLTVLENRSRNELAQNAGALLHCMGLVSALAAVGGPQAGRAHELVKQLQARLRNLKQPVSDGPVAPDQRLMERFGAADVPVETSAQALGPIASDLVNPSWPVTPQRPQFAVDRGALLARLDPATTSTARIRGRLGTLPPWLPPDWFDDGLVQPIMAGPVFVRPMYQGLADYDREWLIPGVAAMPDPDMVTALVTNGEFVESFLVGLSHEMGRKLLWRGYPTDERNTYFRRFWNGDVDELSADIHRFAPTELGSHLIPTLSGRIAVLVRGQLIRRYPNAVVLAMRANHVDQGRPVFSADPAGTATVLFHDHLAPDTVIVGFDLDKTQIRNEDWWFLIAEHPGAPRFGLAAPPPPPVPPPPVPPPPVVPTREDLAWGNLPMVLDPDKFNSGFLSALTTADITDPGSPTGTSRWGSDAATGAHLLLIDPFRAAFEALSLLEPTGTMS
jgi:hypothetical protein